MRILVVADYFLPGYRAGGPIRSLANFARRFSSEHELYVVTRDGDFGCEERYPGIDVGTWNTIEGVKVRYLPPEERSRKVFAQIAQSLHPDVIYFNSLFSPFTRKLLIAIRLGQAPPARVLIAVRGELNPGALAIKQNRKRLFLRLAKAMGLFRDASFHASSDVEASSIRKTFANHRIHIALNIPDEISITRSPGRPKRCRFVFIGRLSRIKNLEIALEAIAELHLDGERFDATFDIHGESSDGRYQEKIEEIVARCGGSVTLHGSFQHEQVWQILEQASFSVLPSRGENFGHSIYESAASGVPFLISDRTPWTDIAEGGAGWVIPVDDRAGWKQALLSAIAMTDGEYDRYATRCVDGAGEMRAIAIRQHEAIFGLLTTSPAGSAKGTLA